MTIELYCLTLASVFTACQWMPYILNQVAVRGMSRAMGNPQPDDLVLALWADRAKRAHYNSIENLVPFGLMVLIAHAAAINSPLTAKAAMVFLLARLFHYLMFVAGVPFVRTILFVVSWSATVTFGVVILKAGWS